MGASVFYSRITYSVKRIIEGTLATKVLFNKMIGQKTINSFFSPVSKKRVSEDLNETREDAKEPVSVAYYSFN